MELAGFGGGGRDRRGEKRGEVGRRGEGGG